MASKRKIQDDELSNEEPSRVTASQRRKRRYYFTRNDTRQQQDTQPEQVTQRNKNDRTKRKLREMQERQRRTDQKRLSPITKLLSENMQTFLEQTEYLTKIDQHARSDIHKKTHNQLADFKLEYMFMTVVDIARHMEPEPLRKIEWRPSELLGIVHSTLKEVQGHAEGDRKNVCLDPEDTENFLCGDEESNKLALRTWDTLLTWGLNEAAAGHTEIRHCSCSKERILRVELQMASDPQADCRHTERVMKFRERVSKILIRYLFEQTSSREPSPGRVTRSKDEAENDRRAQEQLWTEDAFEMIREKTNPAVAKGQSSEPPTEVTERELAMYQPSFDSGPPSGVETRSVQHHRQQSIMGTVISQTNQGVDALSNLRETRPIPDEEPRSETRTQARQGSQDLRILIEREVQSRTTAMQADMEKSFTQRMKEEELRMVKQLRDFCVSEIHQGIQKQSPDLERAINSVSTVQILENNEPVPIKDFILHLQREIVSLQTSNNCIALACNDFKTIEDDISAQLKQLATQIDGLQRENLHQKMQVEQAQRQVEGALTEKISEVALHITEAEAKSLHKAEEAAVLRKTELAEIQKNTNEKIAAISQADLDRYRVMQLKAAKTRARHDAEIQYLKLMAEKNAKGIVERLKNIENTNEACNAALKDQSKKLTAVITDIERINKDIKSAKTELRAELDSSQRTSTAQVIKDSTLPKQNTEYRLKNLGEAILAIEDDLGAQKTATVQLSQQMTEEVKQLKDLISNEKINIQLTNLQSLNELAGMITNRVDVIQENIKAQTQDIQTIKTLKTPKNPKTCKTRKPQSQGYALRTNARIKELRTTVERLEERDMELLDNFKKVKESAGRTLDANTNRTRRLEKGLTDLRNSRAKELDLQTRLEGLDEKISGIYSFIEEANGWAKNKMKELEEKTEELASQLKDFELKIATLVHQDESFRYQTMDMLRTETESQDLETIAKLQNPKQTAQISPDTNQARLKTPLLEIQAVPETSQDELNTTLKTVREDMKKLECNSEGHNKKTSTLSQDLNSPEHTVTQSLQSKTTAFEALSGELRTQMADLERKAQTSISTAERLQVRCENLETDMKRILEEIFPISNSAVGSLYIITEEKTDLEQLGQAANTADDHAESPKATVRYQDRHERPLEYHSQGSKDMKDVNTDISPSLDRCPTSEADAADHANQPEACPARNNPIMRDQTNSTETPKKRLHKPVEKPSEEDTVFIDEAAIKHQADQATTENGVEVQLTAIIEKLKSLEQHTECLKFRTKACDKAGETADFEQSACGYGTPQRGICDQNEDSAATTHGKATIESSGLVWAFQKLEKKEDEILRVIEHYEKQRSKHLKQCQAYFDHTKAKTERLKDQVTQLRKDLKNAVQEIQHRDEYIATISKAEDIRHINSDLVGNGDKQAKMVSALASNRKQTDPKPHSDETCFEVDGGKTEPHLEENNGATIATRGRRKGKKTARKLEAEHASLGTSHSVSSNKLVNTAPLESIPSCDDNVDYLQPGFNPNSVTRERLKNILNAHSIDFRHNSKKEILVALFKDEIEPRACATLKERENIKPSAKGIIDMRF